MCYHSSTEARNQARNDVTFPLNQPGDKEPIVDFTFNQSEAEQQLEGDVFREFSTGEREGEGEYDA